MSSSTGAGDPALDGQAHDAVEAASHAAEEPATLQSSLEVADEAAPDDGAAARPTAAPSIADPVALLRHLDVSGHFHRDSRLGRAYHRGMVSLRENVPTDSLHVVVDDNHVKAHVDGVSPLVVRSGGRSRYSARRAVAHNIAGMATDVVWLVRGRQGDHSCVLNCEWVSSAAQDAARQARLLDPQASAWSVQLEARVAGALDETRLRAALRVALGPPTPQRDPLDVVDCPDDDTLEAARARLLSLDLPVTARPPLHVYLARHPAGDILMLNVNHAAADGPGAVHVLRAIARAYAGAGEAETGAPLDFLASRELPVRPASPSTSLAARSGKRAAERLRDLLARPARLAADEPTDRTGQGFHLVALSAEESARVVDARRPAIGTDVLMAALHLTIGDWNLEHGSPGRHIGVLVPANLRPVQWREEAIGNFSVTARVSTSRRERAGAAAALSAITAQSARNNRTRTGTALIAALERASLLPLWTKQSVVVLQPLTGNHVDAAMLCDLGWIDEAPSFGPDAGETVELWFSTPARSPLSLCVGAASISGRLHLTFRYPHRLFGPDACRRFAECYVDHLRAVAGSRA